MNTKALPHLRGIAKLMDAYAEEMRPEQAMTIRKAVLAVGETVETAHLIARFDYREGRSVQILRKSP